eukprot:gnl/Dysnectes_brevis/2658_a3215_1173.p1 GENE.gnl/Dysnectes_brevis/2658_a3215_1173~~gnl/Dysnectes_brevis/2658_a3215_1173.p1  ORF type:complete len:285 (-),score=78.37 gnl/Dysnectes_brevis/2658_a3215_1173:68-811(-)
MAERAIQLLNIPEGSHGLVLDIGCGSGLSGKVLSEAGYSWVGTDIAPDMLDIAKDHGSEHLVQADMGFGLPFRPGSFDGAISISALQWLCYSNNKEHNPYRRLLRFFQSLYTCLVSGGKAVLQVYPKDGDQLGMMEAAALKAGFTGGTVVDYPNSAMARKYYLTLFAGVPTQHVSMPRGLGTEEEDGVDYQGKRERSARTRRSHYTSDKPIKKSREWLLKKKARMRLQGREVAHDSKYTGRRRRGKF